MRSQRFGGDKRDRTADLLHAMQALSQLSYTPTSGNHFFSAKLLGRSLVELSGIEPLTSCMPCKRSPS
ncbi:Uncharacterized protein {ECO:0000313/EMBL:CDH06504.1} [Pantoea ananatis]|nr:Uncharacterized protein {ECO:0000313/EMBL:CDH06504.1} [Pantoea ananatis]